MKQYFLLRLHALAMLLILLLNSEQSFGKQDGSRCDFGTILIIASYNPDTQRMQEFIRNFEKEVQSVFSPVPMIAIEDIASRGLSEAEQWESRIEAIIKSYQDKKLMSIVLLGQEAWAGYLKYSERYKISIPSYCCFVSQNGIKLPAQPIDTKLWNPPSVNMVDWAKTHHIYGGQINFYDLEKNIRLVKDFLPTVKHLAVVTDNSYGGLSIKAYVLKEQHKYPEYTFSYIDGSEITHKAAIDSIGCLPEHSALLIGTWRVSTDGQYLPSNAIEQLPAKRPKIPAISLTGSGIGLVAIGGYIPKYTHGAQSIVHNLKMFYEKGDSVDFFVTPNQYVFDKSKLKAYGIEQYRLPNGSVFVDNLEIKIQRYEYYIFVIICIVVITIILLTFISFLLYRNRKINAELKEQTIELKEAKNKAEESERIKSAFLANMSHEIRTPLNSIVGFSSLLCDESATVEERSEYGQIIIKNADILLSLINDILDISRLESGQMVFHCREVSVNELCAQGMSIIQGVKKQGIEYVFIPSKADRTIVTDELRILQVLNNLLSNANKFTEHGAITLEYKLSDDQTKLIFSVTDTGCGIAPEKMNAVFSRFEKLNEFKQGTGLGLAISREIIAQLGGTIYVDPDYTKGARFVFTLPNNPPILKSIE